MEDNLVHIAISPNALASLIKEGSIHVMDFKCLDKQAKQIVWGLFLAMLSNKIRMPRSN
jgi:hypothetical protein